jgi:hypothetical protein
VLGRGEARRHPPAPGFRARGRDGHGARLEEPVGQRLELLGAGALGMAGGEHLDHLAAGEGRIARRQPGRARHPLHVLGQARPALSLAHPAGGAE